MKYSKVALQNFFRHLFFLYCLCAAPFVAGIAVGNHDLLYLWIIAAVIGTLCLYWNLCRTRITALQSPRVLLGRRYSFDMNKARSYPLIFKATEGFYKGRFGFVSFQDDGLFTLVIQSRRPLFGNDAFVRNDLSESELASFVYEWDLRELSDGAGMHVYRNVFGGRLDH